MSFYKIIAVCLSLIFLSGCGWFDDEPMASDDPQTFEQKKSALEGQIESLQNCQEGTEEEKAECQTKLGSLQAELQDLLKNQFDKLKSEIIAAEGEAKKEKCDQLKSLQWIKDNRKWNAQTKVACGQANIPGYSSSPAESANDLDKRPYNY